MKELAFFAYPSDRPLVRGAVETAVELAKNSKIEIRPWESMKTVGLKLDSLIRDEIKNANFLIADITYPNFNVYYEIGYAISLGKPVIPAVNISVDGSARRINELGLFDTIGWMTYQNGKEIYEKINDWRGITWVNKFFKPKDHSRPLFFLDSMQKTDFRNDIVHAIENSHVRHRAYDVSEVSRLTAAQAISEISSSAGVIIQIISSEISDSDRHNLRAAFLIGLAHGFGIEALAIQFGNGPAPLDYRDSITNSTFKKETVDHVARYCAETLIRNQEISHRSSRDDIGIIGQIDLGSPVAEYENQQLHDYFIKTAEYIRALRA